MASRFWVGGTGTWDAADTTHWAASSGGAGGQSVPGSSDTVTFDGNSGGGTVTVNFGGTVTIQSLTMGAFAGTFDNSANNNPFTITNNSGNVLNGSGTAVRTYNLGSATYTISGSSPTVTFANAANLTLNGTSSTISFTGSNSRTLTLGTTTGLGTINVASGAGSGGVFNIGANTTATIGALNVTAPNHIAVGIGSTITITNAISWVGTASTPLGIVSSQANLQGGFALAASSTITWAAIRDIGISGSPTITNSLDHGGNGGGAVINPPSVGGGGGYVIGS